MSNTKIRPVFSGLNPEMRFEIVLDYAAKVLGTEERARIWIDALHAQVRQGTQAVSEACRTSEGFREAMAALHRIRVVGKFKANRPNGADL